MMGLDSATWAVAVAFVVLGLLTEFGSFSAGWNWVIAGIVALLVAWAGSGMKKK